MSTCLTRRCQGQAFGLFLKREKQCCQYHYLRLLAVLRQGLSSYCVALDPCTRAHLHHGTLQICRTGKDSEVTPEKQVKTVFNRHRRVPQFTVDCLRQDIPERLQILHANLKLNPDMIVFHKILNDGRCKHGLRNDNCIRTRQRRQHSEYKKEHYLQSN